MNTDREETSSALAATIVERQRQTRVQIEEERTAARLLRDYKSQQLAGHALTPEQVAEFEQAKDYWMRKFGFMGGFTVDEIIEAIDRHITNLQRMVAD